MKAALRTIEARPGRSCFGLLLLAVSQSALAHSTTQGVGDFYAGVLHPLTALEHILPFIALGLLVGQQAKRAQEVVPIFSVALMLGAGAALFLPASPLVTFVNLLSGAVLGGLAALAWNIPTAVFWSIGAVFGLTHGLANGEAVNGNIRWYLFIPGVGIAGLLVVTNVMLIADYLVQRKENWLKIAVRVAGSWIAAIGILVLAAGSKAIFKS
jgi:urease accessory protein